MPYFNHRAFTAVTRWERWHFWRHWWQIYATDRRWTPPYYPALRDALHSAHVARQNPQLVHVEALYRRARSGQPDLTQTMVQPGMMETAVATAILLQDPRRRDQTATLAYLQCINDADTLDYLLGYLMEQLAERGYFRLVGPVGFAPQLAPGVLGNAWDQPPPADTAYNPPYLPELLSTRFSPLAERHLYHLSLSAEATQPGAEPAQLAPLDWAWWVAEGGTWVETAVFPRHFPPPDQSETKFLRRWWRLHGVRGWMAGIAGQPVGFILLQPDLGPLLRQTRGGRPWWGWLWWTVRGPRAARSGRVVQAVVAPAWRGRGIMAQLWQQAVWAAQQAGWRELLIGPLAEAMAADLPPEARPRQRYQIYEWRF